MSIGTAENNIIEDLNKSVDNNGISHIQAHATSFCLIHFSTVAFTIPHIPLLSAFTYSTHFLYTIFSFPLMKLLAEKYIQRKKLYTA